MTQTHVAIVGLAVAILGVLICAAGLSLNRENLIGLGFAMLCGGGFALIASIPYLPAS